MGRLWPDLERWERRARLAELGLTEPMLLAIAEADSELAPQLRAQRTPEDAIRAALRWYEQHPLPAKLRSWSPMTGQAYEAPPRRPELALQRLERLPLLDDDDASTAVAQRDPLPVPATSDAVGLRIVDRLSWAKIEQAVGLSHRKVDYVRLALKHGDLGWDLDLGCITLGAETRNTAAGLVLPLR
jgi:hypothetical protein